MLPTLYVISKASCQWYTISSKFWGASLVAQMVKRLPAMRETWVRFLGREDPLEKEMAIHSSTLAWKIPWMEEPGRLQSMGSRRVGHDWVTLLSLWCIGEGNGNPFQCSCLENPRDRGAWWAAVYGVTQSQTRLRWLSSSSSIFPTWLLGMFFHRWFSAYIIVCFISWKD